MERTKYILIISVLTLFTLEIKANYKSRIYQAYISNNLVSWKAVLDEMQARKDKSHAFTLELINYQYGYIAWNIGNKKPKEAEKYLELAENHLKTLESASYQISYINSYKSAFYGFRIGLNKLQAPFIGPKSVDCAKKAMQQDANNPYGFIQYGNSQYYMPAMFGGSKTIALEYYKKALKIMEQSPEQIRENWNYLNLLTQIALAYQELKLWTSAKVYFEKILQIEPAYQWVRDDLYPSFLKKIK